MSKTQKETNMKKLNKKGFTLAELLIVVAIIAVLVAIAIPVFTSQLEKAREATDLANIRAAYAEASADLLQNDESTYSRDIVATQKKAKWQTAEDAETYDIGELHVTCSTTGWTVGVDTTNNAVTITVK